MKFYALVGCFLHFFASSTSSLLADTPLKLKRVKVSFIEALDPKDTTSSKRFQDEYELAIQTGIKLTRDRLSSCGYMIEPTQHFYAASDPIQAKEQAEISVKEDSWFIVGPRRSNHYILLTQGAIETPTVSLMASSDDISGLGFLHLSMSPRNSQMAAVLAGELKKKFSGKMLKYVSIVASDCLSCKDFAKHFDSAAEKLGIKKLPEVAVIGDQPDLSNIGKILSLHQPEIILLPNYSILTGYLISELSRLNSNLFFAGGDGWGDSNFGFVQNGQGISKSLGMTVRGIPPYGAVANSIFSDFPTSNKVGVGSLASSSALSILKIFSGMSEFLCGNRPQTKEAFARSFKSTGMEFFNAPWGVSVYKLSSGNITFEKTIEAH